VLTGLHVRAGKVNESVGESRVNLPEALGRDPPLIAVHKFGDPTSARNHLTISDHRDLAKLVPVMQVTGAALSRVLARITPSE
jgi:hypothetical protein